MLGYLVREYMKFFRALTGKTKKCLVIDLDNTLWGGVIGEEGANGIKLGPTYPGSAYVAFQREILNLHKRGIILAVASKNNLADVDAVFAINDQMVLKKEHFAAFKVSWNPKSQSLREISAELNIDLDQIVFVDDNPAECQLVASTLPMVTVLALPQQPERFIHLLLDDGLFDSLTVSREDGRRGLLYRQRAAAETLRSQSESLEAFYRGLEMVVKFAPVNDSSLARAAQLTQKTNQFNVTTIRYSEAELHRRMGDRDWLMMTVQLRDRFGDNGVVGFMMAHASTETLEIDTLLLSCRVIGRTVETAMLAHLLQKAAARGIRQVVGRIISTPKNLPVRDIFERHGFRQTTATADGETFWSCNIADSPIVCPEWIKVHNVSVH